MRMAPKLILAQLDIKGKFTIFTLYVVFLPSAAAAAAHMAGSKTNLMMTTMKKSVISQLRDDEL